MWGGKVIVGSAFSHCSDEIKHHKSALYAIKFFSTSKSYEILLSSIKGTVEQEPH
jgi:hypothetical protein